MTDRDRTRVVIVDDEPDLLGLFETWLSRRWAVETATDGRTALELVDDGTELVVLDRRMPGMSGDAVLDRLRDDGYDGAVVFVSAAEPDADLPNRLFDRYLVKPVSRDDLVEVAEGILNGRAPEDEIASDRDRTPDRAYDQS